MGNKAFAPNTFHLPWYGKGKHVLFLAFLLLLWFHRTSAQSASSEPELNDSHFHLTNYI